MHALARARLWLAPLAVAALAVAALAVAALAVAVAPTASAKASYPVLRNIGTALAISALNPAAPPPGVNVPCTPSATHPYPVILIDGTHVTMETNWAGLGPTLANNGYCVYSAAIGGDPHSLIQTCGPVLTSVAQIAALVDQVLATTHASKVDLVGHSQGGLIAEYYTKFDGRGKVNSMALLAPTTHGGTTSGLSTLPPPLGPLAVAIQGVDCPAFNDQLPNSAVVRALNTGPVTVPGVSYTVIETIYEEVVTPAPQAAFIAEPGVHNLILQRYCPFDLSEHVLLAYSAGAWNLVLNALDPGHPRAVGCF